ncbi:MAG TPA: tail assembly chaperone [Candidatus Limosilactobacillus intestinavium]|nr:tail assembly chaperone [Candidatus Limosilactobacillus intestinavium]
MQIKIKNKNYDLNFGVRFVRELDKLAGMKVKQNGIEQSFGMGITMTMPSLRQYDPATLATVLYCATWDNAKRPSLNDIDDFIDDSDTDLIKLFDNVLTEMNKANAVKVVVSKMPKNTKA